MKELLIVRHAEAISDFENFKDFDRPLNNYGQKDAKIMAKQLIKHNFYPDYIMSSGASRAYSTAKIISKEMKISKDNININNDIYSSSKENILESIYNISDKFNSVMITGHNPIFHILSQLLTKENILNFPTCSMYCIIFDINHWSKLDIGKKKFFIYPSMF